MVGLKEFYIYAFPNWNLMEEMLHGKFVGS